MRFALYRYLAVVVMALGLFVHADEVEVRVTFLLVPQEAWDRGRPDMARVVGEGTVFLYREGDEEPRLTAAAGEPVVLPRGRWIWTAQAPGYATVSAGVLNNDGGLDGKRIVWPVVPACRVSMSDTADWAPVHRLDVVSVRYGATQPLKPSRLRDAWIPAGELLAYSVGSRGLIGIRRLGACRQGEEVEVSPPAHRTWWYGTPSG